jgi:F0F1-type ATP synthase delta subunit
MKPEKMSDEQKLQAVFNLLYVTISNARINNFQEILTHSFFEQLLGFEGEKLKMFTKFVKRNQRFQNPEDFVKYYEKYFNYIGNQMLRKISKLYAITNK